MISNPNRSGISKASWRGLQIAKSAGGFPRPAPLAAAPATPVVTGPDAPHIAAQDRVVKGGGKLSDQEKFKRELHPFDGYEKLKAQAAGNEPPKPDDNFRWRFYGLFYVRADADDLHVPAAHSQRHPQRTGSSPALPTSRTPIAGGYAHVTTRANLQMREIEPKNAVDLVEGIQDLGLCSRGSGADNIRNVTGTPTAGIDPQELSTRGPTRASGTSTSSTTARSTACRASSTSGSTAPA